jgi:hypothetical protein
MKNFFVTHLVGQNTDIVPIVQFINDLAWLGIVIAQKLGRSVMVCTLYVQNFIRLEAIFNIYRVTRLNL